MNETQQYPDSQRGMRHRGLGTRLCCHLHHLHMLHMSGSKNQLAVSSLVGYDITGHLEDK
jgi:hypothetical protein